VTPNEDKGWFDSQLFAVVLWLEKWLWLVTGYLQQVRSVVVVVVLSCYITLDRSGEGWENESENSKSVRPIRLS